MFLPAKTTGSKRRPRLLASNVNIKCSKAIGGKVQFKPSVHELCGTTSRNNLDQKHYNVDEQEDMRE